MRIGNGFDVHALVQGRKLMLGGVKIPHPLGLAGHSDADVLLHAMSDAMLRALALGDIGRHFPDTDARWKGADSRALPRHVGRLAADGATRSGTSTPRSSRRRRRSRRTAATMRANIAADLGCAPDCVRVKATTTEGLGLRRTRGEGTPRWRRHCWWPAPELRRAVTRPSAIPAQAQARTVPPPSRGSRSKRPPCSRAMRPTIASPVRRRRRRGHRCAPRWRG
ncbi:MAG: 2-C-methyl-D-erythritol 2,4-cyclodiphosphate synthase [Betaproteobacteria bacterium]|nr:2-C-methyl-D-erythritol 2,4-cyclodiphosphate synthase [Betaproteobacteria bacterium]